MIIHEIMKKGLQKIGIGVKGIAKTARKIDTLAGNAPTPPCFKKSQQRFGEAFCDALSDDPDTCEDCKLIQKQHREGTITSEDMKARLGRKFSDDEIHAAARKALETVIE